MAFFTALTTLLHKQNVSAYFLLEADPTIGQGLSVNGTAFSALADNVLLMRRTEVNNQLVQSLVVLKMRFGKPDRMFHLYSVEDNGFNIAPTRPSAARIKRGRSS
jgi:KaiC/GvpD/RAD55 family RecA-like ATPase